MDHEIRFRAGERVFEQDDAISHVFKVSAGALKISVLSADGREAVVSVVGPGQFFGEACAAQVGTATALTDGSAIKFDRAQFIRRLEDDFTFSKEFLAHLVARARRVEFDLVDQIFHTSEIRLAKALLQLSEHEGGDELLASMSQQTLADMIGTTRSRVNYFLTSFRRRGLIADTVKIKINRPAIIKMLAALR